MSPNLQRGGIVLSTSENLPQRKLDTVQYLCYHRCNDQETVYIFTIPILLYLFPFTFEKTVQHNTVNKHIEEPTEFTGAYRLQFRTD